MILFNEQQHPHNCRDCRHYSRRPELPLPYLCRAMGYQGKLPPSRVIFNNFHSRCELYETG